MSTPAFSILVPTRDRPATLRHTLDTIASQPGDDYEIVVADNCSGPETRAIVEALDARKVRYVRSDEVLPMAENWERGLAACSGEYVTVLGDDDGFVPSTLQMARTLIELSGAEVLFWSPHTYWWPDTIVPWNRNLLIVDLRQGAIEVDSRQALEEFYAGKRSFGEIPMIYSGFFHRGIVEEARRRHGRFFTPVDTAPDIASGILGLHLTSTHARSNRPLTIRGNSGKSNGTAQWARSLGAEQREIYFREERIGLKGMIHERLVPSPNLHIIVASAKLKCKEAYFPGDRLLEVDLRRLVQDMVDSLNFEPEAYEDNVRDLVALAEKVGVPLRRESLPAQQLVERRLSWGPAVSGEGGGAFVISVNGNLARLENVADAGRLIEALLPPAESYLQG